MIGAARRSVALGLLAFGGCAAWPEGRAGGERALADAFVTLASPVEIPAMAARDAWKLCHDEPDDSVAWLPLAFLGFTLEHTGLSVLHTFDLAATPIHLLKGDGPPRIYQPYSLPMGRVPDADLGGEAGELALYGIAAIGGSVIAWWFGTSYVPHLFHYFTD